MFWCSLWTAYLYACLINMSGQKAIFSLFVKSLKSNAAIYPQTKNVPSLNTHQAPRPPGIVWCQNRVRSAVPERRERD